MQNSRDNTRKSEESEQDDYDYNTTLPVSDESESDSDKKIEEEIYPGLVLKNEYLLLKKIGCGNNATVWITYRLTKKSFVAVKIQDFRCYNDGCREVTIIKKINDYYSEKANQNRKTYCVKMLDFFVYASDNNTKYVCSIYELFAGSVQMLLNQGKYKYGLPIPVVKKIMKQLLSALVDLHNNLRIIHTDIKPENLLFRGIPEYQQIIMDTFIQTAFQQKYEKLLVQHKRNINTNTIFSDDENTAFDSALACLATDSITELYKISVINAKDEVFNPDEDENSEDYMVEGDDDGDDGYDSNSNASNEEEEEDGYNVFNERNQSVDDVMESLDYTDIHDLEEEGAYDFIHVLNNRTDSSDKKTVIDDKYVFDCETALTDFGNSYFFEKRTKNEIQDRRYRSPEVVLDLNYGFAADIWSVACVAFELLTGFPLFEPEDEPLNRDIHHLFLMEKNLGPIPFRMKKMSKRNRFLFDKKRNYHIKNVAPFKQYNLQQRLVLQFSFTKNEAREIYDFLICGLEYDPTKRASAKELLQHKWLNKA